MKAIVVMDQAAGMAGMKLVERPQPSVPVVQFSGGLVVASIGWSLLNQKLEKRSSADVQELDSTA